MTLARKIRLVLTDDQRAILDGQSKICNWQYNHLLEIANDLRKQYIVTTLYTKYGLRNLVTEIKQTNKFLLAVHSSPLKNAALRLTDAIQDYQDVKHGRRKGRQTGWPHFRSWHKKGFFSLLYDEPSKGWRIDGNILALSLGENEENKRIRLELQLLDQLPEKYKDRVTSLRITRDGQHQYFAIFTIGDNHLQQLKKKDPETGKIKISTVKTPAQTKTPQLATATNPRIIAFDPNHKNLVYGVDSENNAIEVENIDILKGIDAKIDNLKSRRDKCKKKSIKVERENGSSFWKPSRRWTFFNNLLNEAYRIRREQTKTYLYTLANQICKRYDVILVGNYTPHGNGITTPMRRSMNNQSLIGRFKGILKWVAARSGKIYDEVNETGTTRTCSNVKCRYVVADGIPLDVREWTCPRCGVTHIRDENSAINIIRKAILEKNLLHSSCRFGDDIKVFNRRVWRVTPSGVDSTLRGCCGSEITLNTAKKLKRQDANLTTQLWV